ncbi:hypothetical protein PybrP1_003722 [[Pythium] brassicae (nom. inval.)]|nr:hypothetical protein PybrP1_003722 [[Pythium] brassicae (nom. inval.)]
MSTALLEYEDDGAVGKLPWVARLSSVIPRPTDFVAFDDTFLDAVAEMLQRLAVSCQDALEWSSDSEVTILRAAEAFQDVALVCRDAGIAVADVDFGDPFDGVQHSEQAHPTELRLCSPSSLSSSSRCASSRCDEPATNVACPNSAASWWSIKGSHAGRGDSESEGHPARLFRLTPVRDDIVEIELTDLLVNTHEELHACKNELFEHVREVDARCSDSHSQAQHEVSRLQHALETSQAEMTRMQQELRSTQQCMLDLQAAVATSQQAVEATVKEQGRQWKAVCNDLVVEKRNVAKKLAEERGKCAALKEHLAIHVAGVRNCEMPSTGTSPGSRARIQQTASTQTKHEPQRATLATHAGAVGAAATAQLPGWFKRMQTTNEYNLPRLPVPQLGDTLERYLESVRPLLDAQAWAAHAELARAFETGEGRVLQEQLLKRELSQAMGRAYPFSYIEADWDKMYLGGRYESPINVNPAYGLVDETDGNLAGMVPRAAAFVRSAAKWWEKVKRSELEQDKNQCMFSFARQFGTAKIPQPERDVLVSSPRSSHIVVLKGTQFFQLDVLSPDGKQLLSQAALEQRLDEILNAPAKAEHSDLDLSTLTAENRDAWARVRADLVAHDPVNAASLSAIDSALFVLVLEERASADTKDRMELALHGKGAGRWFDKVQVAVQPDGHLTVNFEHSFSDGTAWNRWLHEVWHDMRGTPSGFAPLADLPEFVDAAKPRRLAWKLSANLVEDVKQAEAHFAAFADNLASEFLTYANFAKRECKQWQLSPDGVAQMALQLAFVRAHGGVAATYESCATRAFLHGRTETIRALTPAAAEFARAVAGGQASTATQRELLVAAVNRHVEMAKMAQKGLGVDRHLTALASLAGEHGVDSAFLASPARAASTNFQISSSNVTTPFLQYFNFGAVVPDGYGVGYLLHSDVINVSLTNFKDSRVTDSAKYKQALKESLDTIKALADSAPAP